MINKAILIGQSKKDEDSTYIPVLAAGDIQISNSANWRTMGVYGFSFGVEWGKFGYGGGVLSRENARTLAEHILTTLDEEE